MRTSRFLFGSLTQGDEDTRVLVIRRTDRDHLRRLFQGRYLGSHLQESVFGKAMKIHVEDGAS